MKEIILKENSIFAKLYTFFYRKELPNGLCTFFWANILAFVLLLPYTIISLPLIVIILFDDGPFLDTWSSENNGNGSFLGKLVGLWFNLFIIISYFLSMYYGFSKGFNTPNTIFFWIVNGIALFITLMYLCNKVTNYVKTKRRDRKVEKIKKEMLSRGMDVDNYSIGSILHLGKMFEKEVNEEEKDVEYTSFLNVVYGSIKAFFEKNCPRITWK